MINKIHTYKTGYYAGKTIKVTFDDNGNPIAKECDVCKQVKSLSEFSPHGNKLFSCKTKCKTCRNEINQDKYYKSKTDYWLIYLIDNFDGKGNHYVGITRTLPKRLSTHRCHSGADTSYVLEMDRVETKELALQYESEYHKKGYCGSDSCKIYKELKENHKLKQ